jgi:hypothetical protein
MPRFKADTRLLHELHNAVLSGNEWRIHFHNLTTQMVSEIFNEIFVNERADLRLGTLLSSIDVLRQG